MSNNLPEDSASSDANAPAFTLGVEEEYQIVDVETRQLRPRSEPMMQRAQALVGESEAEEVQHEMYLSQIEIASPVCSTLGEARTQLAHLRGALIAAAKANSSRLAAGGTHPFSGFHDQTITPKDRYENLRVTFQQLVKELLIFGCHVHVGIADRELGLQVMNRARPWLASLLALSANSPFWQGEDTGYASYRTELWGRFPQSGPPLLFADTGEYDAVVNDLVATGVIRDGTNIYWDIRLSPHAPTVEFRVADVCLTIDEAVMIAGLVRGIATACREQAQANAPFAAVRPEVMRAAHWQAARYGLDGELIDPGFDGASGVARRPAREIITALLEFVRPTLEQLGDWETVSAQVETVLSQGNGAARQRRIYAQTGRLEAVVDYVTEQTASGIEK